MKNLCYLLFLLLSFQSFSQELSGKELLEKAIQFHDPNNHWPVFSDEFTVTMKSPNNSDRVSHIFINLPEEYFSVSATRDENTTTYVINKDQIHIGFNGEKNPSKSIREKYNLSNDRAKLYKNYYTYLYGLPMKLKDKGTIIYEKVSRKQFKGKEYLVVKVTYPKEIGEDTWYFYFNPTTYAMEIYQFFKESEDSGEYIILSGLEEINGIKMPKIRAWYYNKDDKYLGTDYLTKEK